MIWAGILGASSAFRAAADPTLFPGMRDMPGRMEAALSFFRAGGVLVFSAPVIWFSIFDSRMKPLRGFLGRSLSRSAEMIDVSTIWFTAAVPLAFAIIVLRVLAMTLVQLTRQRQPQPATSSGKEV